MTEDKPHSVNGSNGMTAAKWSFDIIVADGFVMTEMAAVVDTIRLANRVSAQEPFTWTYRSSGGGIIEASCGAFVKSEPFLDRPDANYVFVIGNSNQDSPDLSISQVISSYTYRQAQVFLLAESASRYIKEHGRKMQNFTTHWENTALMRERSGAFDPQNSIAEQEGAVFTCAGMGTTVDVILSVVGRHVSVATKMTVANILLHDKIRDFSTPQPFTGTNGTSTGDRELDQCIEIMQANIEDPLPIGELGDVIGISNRSLERKFKSYLGATPNGYYRELRLAKANNLLLNTTMSVREVGLACGFANGFSGLYKNVYGMTPFALRKRRRLENRKNSADSTMTRQI
jgi:transcriptional regulator GlxA family with amidase domain